LFDGSACLQVKMKQKASGRWVAFEDVAKLEPTLAIDTLARVIEETAIMKALVMIHGRERGAERYVEAGGHIRKDGDRWVIWVSEGNPKGKASDRLRSQDKRHGRVIG
jgi:hypothetical protein